MGRWKWRAKGRGRGPGLLSTCLCAGHRPLCTAQTGEPVLCRAVITRAMDGQRSAQADPPPSAGAQQQSSAPAGYPSGRAAQVCAAGVRKGPLWGCEPNAVDRSPVQASYTWDHQRALYSVWGVFRKEPWVQAAVLTLSELWNGKGCSCNPSSPLCPSEGEGETTASSKCNSESEGQGGATGWGGGDGGERGTQGTPRLGPGLCCAGCT